MYSIHQPCQSLFGGLQRFVAEVYRTAVVGLQGEESDGHWAVGLLQHGVRTFEELFQCDEVTVRLTHFLSIHGQHVVVHPIMYHIFSLGSYGLCNLAFVMREDKVHTATMNVEVLAQVFLSHGCTFGVPAGEAVAPRGRPTHDVFRLRTFPEGKVCGIVLLALSVQFAGGVENIIQVASGELAVVMVLVVFFYIEINGTFTFIGISVLQYLLYKFYLFDDVAAGMWLDTGRQHIQCIHRLMIAVDVVLCHFHWFQLFQTGFFRNLVFTFVGIVLQMAHVGNVADIAHLVADVRQVAEQQVESDGRACMSQVRVTVHGRSADIHAYMRCMQRYEQLFFSI